jgi:hypothetical protein
MVKSSWIYRANICYYSISKSKEGNNFTFHREREEYDSYLMVSFEIEVNHEVLINEKILPLLCECIAQAYFGLHKTNMHTKLFDEQLRKRC